MSKSIKTTRFLATLLFFTDLFFLVVAILLISTGYAEGFYFLIVSIFNTIQFFRTLYKLHELEKIERERRRIEEESLPIPSRPPRQYVRRNQIIYHIVVGILGGIIVLSNFLPWDTYLTMNSLLIGYLTGIFIPIVKTFSPLTWVWSDVVPFLSFFPLFGGLLILIGLIFYSLEYSYGKKLMAGGAIIAILIYALYILLFWLIPKIMEAMGVGYLIWLEEYRIPNEFGAYFCLIPGIASIPFLVLIKLPEIKEEEPLALKKMKVAVPYKKTKPAKGTKFCSNCGAIIKEDSVFCNQCGTYF